MEDFQSVALNKQVWGSAASRLIGSFQSRPPRREISDDEANAIEHPPSSSSTLINMLGGGGHLRLPTEVSGYHSLDPHLTADGNTEIKHYKRGGVDYKDLKIQMSQTWLQ